MDPTEVAVVQSMAALALIGDLAAYLAGQDPEGFKRHADKIAEKCEIVLSNTEGPGPIGTRQEMIFREVAKMRLQILTDAVRG